MRRTLGSSAAKVHIDIEKDEDALARLIAQKYLEQQDGYFNLDADALIAAAARGKPILR